MRSAEELERLAELTQIEEIDLVATFALIGIMAQLERIADGLDKIAGTAGVVYTRDADRV